MKYKEIQRRKAVEMRFEIFRDKGNGKFRNKSREFVLSKPALNLWSGIREDALAYHSVNKIKWWSTGDEPTGHLLSSQIACINHLYCLRQRQDLATAVLQTIAPTIQKAGVIDTGFVEFEKVGKQKLGKERLSTRGANCTSIDAMMLGEDTRGRKTLFIIEWKYTETYSGESKLKGASGKRRMAAYKELLEDSSSPIRSSFVKELYYEPFYQLMRQSLLAWQMTARREYGAQDWVHVHVIPNDNKELRETKTSPRLPGKNITEAWKAVLKQPEKYVAIDPKQFLNPISKCPDTKAIMSYLEKRYWD